MTFLVFSKHILQKTVVWQHAFSDKIEKESNCHYFTVNMYGVTSRKNKNKNKKKQKKTSNKNKNKPWRHNVSKQTNITFKLTA